MPSTMNHHLRLLHQPFKILNTNSFHFITLSLLFLPLTFSIIQLHLSSADVTTFLQTLTTFKTITTLLTVIISTVTGVALTTYTTLQAILRTPLTFTSTFKSARQAVMVRVYSFVFVLFTGSMIGVMLYYCAVVNNMESVSKWISIVQVSAYHIQSCMMVALYVVMNSVLYVWFKAGDGDEKVNIMVEEGGGFSAKDMIVLVHGGFSYTLHLFVIVAFISLYVGFH